MFTFVSYRQYVLRIALCVSQYVSYRVFFRIDPAQNGTAFLHTTQANQIHTWNTSAPYHTTSENILSTHFNSCSLK